MMPDLPQETKKQLLSLGVQAVYLFGSRAQGNESELSDYDYAVLVQPGHSRGDELYHELYSLFDKISPRTKTNDVIDIVFLHDTNLELRFHVIRHGVVLLDADSRSRLDFESDTMLRYCDYRPILDEFDRAILESL